jgi:hypothetical protein
MSRALMAIGTLVVLTGAAHANPNVEQQVEAIYKAWMEADTPQNRELARRQGRPIEATTLVPMEAGTPNVPGTVRFPLFQRREKEGAVSGRAGKGGTHYYWNYKGPATLMIAEDGPAYRTHKGYRSIAKYWSGRVSKNREQGYSKPRALYWPMPRVIAEDMPKVAARFGAWRAKRILRKAVKAGCAPTAQEVKQHFTRAKADARVGAVKAGVQRAYVKVMQRLHRGKPVRK